jgi:hypothetical protein
MAEPDNVPEPWDSFFRDLDAELGEEVCLCCAGGFAMTIQYGLPRQTSDVDVLSIEPVAHAQTVLSIAGEGKKLHVKHRVYVQEMGGIVNLPHNHEERATELFPARYKRLRLFGVDPYDLALSKLERNNQIDRDDIKYLFKTIPLDLEVLADRYRTEQRPYLSNESKHDLTMSLWLEMLKEP